MEDVLRTYCSDHIKQIYATLNQDAKSKLLLALRSVLQKRLDGETDRLMMKELFYQPKISNAKRTDDDPVLTKAYRSMGAKIVLEDYSELKQTLRSWGMPKPFLQAVIEQHENIAQYKAMEERRRHNNTYIIIRGTSHAVSKDVSNVDFIFLEKIFIRDLKLFQTATGKFLEGKIVTPPIVNVGVTTLLEDDNGDYVQLGLNNMVTSGPTQWEVAEKKFPVGMKIKISQPFYKIFTDGYHGIRVDSPAEVYSENPNSHLTVAEIRSRGKVLMEAGEYFEALELYLEGLKTTQIEDLLSNRSQAEIKLEQYEEALLDAASISLFSNNAKANERYMMAAQKLGFNKEDKTSIFSIWKRVLQHQRKDQFVPILGNKESGNEAFKIGNYEEAKKIYSSALKDSDACILLNNIAVVCLKLDLFHTAISAASACLQMSTQAKVRGKAHYSMAKALALLGEMDLSKLSIGCDPTLDKFWREEIAKIWDAVFAPNAGTGPMNFSKHKPETWDFVKTDAIEHAYIEGRGRGIRAKRNIETKELLVVDHDIAVAGVKFEQSHVISMGLKSTGCIAIKSHLDLVTKMLTLVKHDGLLGKKIQCLESRGKVDNKKLPLIDLEWMAYRKFSYDVPPFLPQTPEVVGCDMTNLTEPFIDKVVSINTFGDGEASFSLEEGSKLFLRISLLNHDENPNCIFLKGSNAFAFMKGSNAFALVAKRRIRKGEELTIAYVPPGIDTKKWGF